MVQISEDDRRLMQMAIDLSLENVRNGGGPFGAVIARNGEVLAKGVNRVTTTNDPTAHAEVSAIREACRHVGHFKLDGCVCYTSCEPCPMCLSALYWAGVKAIFYANTKEDAADIGFSDDFIYRELAQPRQQRSIPLYALMRDEARVAFREWTLKDDKVEY